MGDEGEEEEGGEEGETTQEESPNQKSTDNKDESKGEGEEDCRSGPLAQLFLFSSRFFIVNFTTLQVNLGTSELRHF